MTHQYLLQRPGMVMEDYPRDVALDSVGAGWAKLVGALWDFCKLYDPPILVSQVKEKFGGLRFYVDRIPEDQYDTVETIISAVESASYKVCELCGEHGELRAGSWIQTRCEEHSEGRETIVEGI